MNSGFELSIWPELVNLPILLVQLLVKPEIFHLALTKACSWKSDAMLEKPSTLMYMYLVNLLLRRNGSSMVRKSRLQTGSRSPMLITLLVSLLEKLPDVILVHLFSQLRISMVVILLKYKSLSLMFPENQ